MTIINNILYYELEISYWVIVNEDAVGVNSHA